VQDAIMVMRFLAGCKRLLDLALIEEFLKHLAIIVLELASYCFVRDFTCSVWLEVVSDRARIPRTIGQCVRCRGLDDASVIQLVRRSGVRVRVAR